MEQFMASLFNKSGKKCKWINC